jgi:hypothetical protein
MWIQMERQFVERLMQLAKDARQVEIIQRLQHFLDLETKDAKKNLRYRVTAMQRHGHEGELEFDDDAVVSVSDGTGAYVMGWRWIEAEELRHLDDTQKIISPS